MLKLTILGSGTMMPTKRRLPSAFLVESGPTKLLLDCGHGALARLVELGVDPRELDGIFISHPHTDHANDAFALVHARFVGDLYENKTHGDSLVFLGPPTLQDRYHKWREIFWPEPREQYPLTFYEEPGGYQVGAISAFTFPVRHVPWFQSAGVRITAEGKTIAYPGDVGSEHRFEDLVEETRNVDLLLIESGYPRPTPNHFTLEQAEELAQKADIGQVLIVHLRPTVEEERRVRDFARGRPNFRVAEDKMVIEL